ncbi:glycosyltransferase family 9 protein [Uliginosibacterium sp. 31-12]|uniref:glycosyltransferase family 9 protein n=1 Tax=Uliginosibacterium sp. 31-12 TaxID=3062781 RepID=UPI0026E44F3A|nr:glycosyltransferase family 9 protein [Uliginosibacterium sp. 31-12]MDO6386151.1 glycosyltransferase family 9 protein [Uliginosibacterium sp. 31-12]
MKILILKRDKLGDMLLTTPMFALLRQHFPGARIDVLANTYNAWVIDGNTDVSRVWSYQRVKEGGRIHWRAAFAQLRQTLALRAEEYDWVIVANGDASHRAIKRAAWLGGCNLVSYTDAKNTHRKVNHPLEIPRQIHEARRMANLLTPLGITLPEELPPLRFHLPAEAQTFATQWLAEQGLAPGGYLTLGLGARRAKKQPTTEQIIRWTRHFHEAWGLKTVFMWTPGKSDNPMYPGDDETAQPVLDAKLPWLVPFRGPLKPALGLIFNGRTSLFPDSGLMHFAAASPGGVLGFFAETDVSPAPAQWGPVGPRARWLEAPKAVSQLEDAAVFAELESLLK